MSSSAIVALFQTSLTCLCAAILVGFLPVSALAEPAQTQTTATVQAVAAAEPHSETGAPVTGASTVSRIPTAPMQPPPLGVAIQPISNATSQSIPTGAVAQLPAKATTDRADVAKLSTTINTTATKVDAVAGASASSAAQSRIDGIELLSPAQRRTYRRAASAFTGFCHDWEHLLHEREVDNLEHLSWREDGGLKTATYTGYGKLESCECKESKEGLPIGKIRYREISYSIMGKTIDEARHAAPKLLHEISTLEIFSWDNGKWFY
jgi:hypothetical protein